MLAFIVTVLVVFGLLLISEIWWRKRPVPDEFSRKFVHITVGCFVAFWPFFLSWHQIEILSLAFLIGVACSKYLHIFGAIHSVQRPTWGEIFFALAVGGIALVTHHKWLYAAALLQMSLADGLAAVVGIRYGQSTQYNVLGAHKSIVGTLTFFVVSIIILGFYSAHVPGLFLSPNLLLVAAAATVIENIGIRGSDNLLVPLVVTGLLHFYPL